MPSTEPRSTLGRIRSRYRPVSDSIITGGQRLPGERINSRYIFVVPVNPIEHPSGTASSAHCPACVRFSGLLTYRVNVKQPFLYVFAVLKRLARLLYQLSKVRFYT